MFHMVSDRKNLIDLLLKMFAYLPHKRITAEQAMNHPFFKGINKLNISQDLQLEAKTSL